MTYPFNPNYIHPPNIVDVEEPVIFLAGPIQGGPNWQPEAAKIINQNAPGIVVASPRFDYPDDTFVYEHQVDWETHFLNRAAKLGGVMFWLAKQTVETPGRAYAQTSRIELGEWKVEHELMGTPLALGIEAGFGNERYIRRRFGQDCPEITIHDTLEATCLDIIAQVK